MVTRTAALKNFLTANAPIDLANLYSFEMECQLNVAADNGERTEGEHNGHAWRGWTDGNQTWKAFRIPWHANAVPEYTDSKMSFDLDAHAEGIGMTGWNWVKRESQWVAFDFDAIVGHAEAHENKLTDAQLKEVQETACKIPWVTVRRSTSGNGLHLYVFVNNVPTANHTEHAALGRAILGKMSAITGFDFDSKVDNCGGNIWVWHRKYANSSGQGLKLLKQGDTLTDIPPNWRDHVRVAAGASKRSKPSFVPDHEMSAFEQLCGTHPNIPLDDGHKALMAFLDKVGALWWFDNDHHMIVCHTADLKRAHTELVMRGIYDTKASGKEHGADQNCYGFPMRNGSWSIRRHTPGVQEHESWDQDASGWTRCFLNKEPDLKTAARAYGGNENDKGGFYFREAEVAIEAAKALGAHTQLPAGLGKVPLTMKPHKDGRLILEITPPEENTAGLSAKEKLEKMAAREKLEQNLADNGWVKDKKVWKLVFGTKANNTVEDSEVVGNFDDLTRHMVTQSGQNAGWVINSEKWTEEPIEHVRSVLLAAGAKPKDIGIIIGQCVLKKWTIVSIPFAEEYPGDRKWNRNGAQLAYAPNPDIDNLKYDTWTSILNHTGSGLDVAVPNNKWCRENGIKTGGDYLKAWVASLFQYPTRPLPYLFLYGEQMSGKSILHEAISLLMTKGCKEAKQALVSQGGYNAELEGAILCYIEEKDLRADRDEAYTRIKEWVTAVNISLHCKNKTPYMLPNTSHWIQCGNDIEFCPVFPGDTRITMCYVKELEKVIGKDDLLAQLRKEAPDFLAAILGYEIPKSNDRLNIPIIDTADKKRIQQLSRNPLQAFISERCFHVPGELVKFSDFYDEFIKQLDPTAVSSWSRIRVGREIPMKYPKGIDRAGTGTYLGNMSLADKAGLGFEWMLNEKGTLIKAGTVEPELERSPNAKV